MKSQVFHTVWCNYFWWACRKKLKLITLGSERVDCTTTLHGAISCSFVQRINSQLFSSCSQHKSILVIRALVWMEPCVSTTIQISWNTRVSALRDMKEESVRVSESFGGRAIWVGWTRFMSSCPLLLLSSSSLFLFLLCFRCRFGRHPSSLPYCG